MTGVWGIPDARVVEISRMTKAQLAGIVRAHRNIVWSARPVERWSKDELISEVVEFEAAQARSGS